MLMEVLWDQQLKMEILATHWLKSDGKNENIGLNTWEYQEKGFTGRDKTSKIGKIENDCEVDELMKPVAKRYLV